jgi:hypothetical protein
MKKAKCSICGREFEFYEGDECAYTIQSPACEDDQVKYYEDVCSNCQSELKVFFENKILEMKKRHRTV